MKILKQLAIILTIYIVSETLVKHIPFGLPASVLGLVSLLALLKFRLIKESDISECAEFITKNMAMFFIPVCLKIFEDFILFKDHLIPILIIVLVTLIITFISSTYITIAAQWVVNRNKR